MTVVRILRRGLNYIEFAGELGQQWRNLDHVHRVAAMGEIDAAVRAAHADQTGPEPEPVSLADQIHGSFAALRGIAARGRARREVSALSRRMAGGLDADGETFQPAACAPMPLRKLPQPLTVDDCLAAPSVRLIMVCPACGSGYGDWHDRGVLDTPVPLRRADGVPGAVCIYGRRVRRQDLAAAGTMVAP